MRIDWIVYMSDRYEVSRKIASKKPMTEKLFNHVKKKFYERIDFAVEHRLIGQEIASYMKNKFNSLHENNISDMRALVNAVRHANKLYQRGVILRNLNTEENK